MKYLTIILALLFSLNINNQTNTWKDIASFPNTTLGAKPIVLGKKIHFIPSSYAPRSITYIFYCYNIPTDEWTKLANMPVANGNLAVAEASGEIFAIGGGFTKTNFKCSPETDTRQTMDSMINSSYCK